MPGSMPTIVPSTTPTNAQRRFAAVSATLKPCSNAESDSIKRLQLENSFQDSGGESEAQSVGEGDKADDRNPAGNDGITQRTPAPERSRHEPELDRASYDKAGALQKE